MVWTFSTQRLVPDGAEIRNRRGLSHAFYTELKCRPLVAPSLAEVGLTTEQKVEQKSMRAVVNANTHEFWCYGLIYLQDLPLFVNAAVQELVFSGIVPEPVCVNSVKAP